MIWYGDLEDYAFVGNGGAIFGPTAINQAVRQTLGDSTIPADHRFAAVISYDDGGKVLSTTIVAKIGDDWRIDGSVRHRVDRWTGTRFEVAATWK